MLDPLLVRLAVRLWLRGWLAHVAAVLFVAVGLAAYLSYASWNHASGGFDTPALAPSLPADLAVAYTAAWQRHVQRPRLTLDPTAGGAADRAVAGQRLTAWTARGSVPVYGLPGQPWAAWGRLTAGRWPEQPGDVVVAGNRFGAVRVGEMLALLHVDTFGQVLREEAQVVGLAEPRAGVLQGLWATPDTTRILLGSPEANLVAYFGLHQPAAQTGRALFNQVVLGSRRPVLQAGSARWELPSVALQAPTFLYPDYGMDVLFASDLQQALRLFKLMVLVFALLGLALTVIFLLMMVDAQRLAGIVRTLGHSAAAVPRLYAGYWAVDAGVGSLVGVALSVAASAFIPGGWQAPLLTLGFWALAVVGFGLWVARMARVLLNTRQVMDLLAERTAMDFWALIRID